MVLERFYNLQKSAFGTCDCGFGLNDLHFPSLSILIAPLTTIKNTMPPTIRSGYFDSVTKTRIPAKITPLLMMTSFDVKIILAFICASSLFDPCRRYKQIELATSARMDTTIIVLKSGTVSTRINRLITSIIPRPARTNWMIPLNLATDFVSCYC